MFLARAKYCVSIRLEFHEAGNVFADDVKFEIDQCSCFDGMDIRMLVGVWDDSHLEPIIYGIKCRKANTIDTYGAFLNYHILR